MGGGNYKNSQTVPQQDWGGLETCSSEERWEQEAQIRYRENRETLRTWKKRPKREKKKAATRRQQAHGKKAGESEKRKLKNGYDICRKTTGAVSKKRRTDLVIKGKDAKKNKRPAQKGLKIVEGSGAVIEGAWTEWSLIITQTQQSLSWGKTEKSNKKPPNTSAVFARKGAVGGAEGVTRAEWFKANAQVVKSGGGV